MKILLKEDIQNNKEFYINEILKGKIFIYPTDTLYGLGCVATKDESVQKIFEIKKRCEKPLLIIIPSIQWIKDNLEIKEEQINEIREKFLKQHSFILKLKNKTAISKYVNNNQETIGIRHPNHWFTKIIEESNLPFVTTSVNLSGEPSPRTFKEINPEILSKVDYIVKDDNSMTQKPSTIIDLTQNNKILR